jgi:hypothetical protein
MAETEAIVYCNRHVDNSIKIDEEIGLGDGGWHGLDGCTGRFLAVVNAVMILQVP